MTTITRVGLCAALAFGASLLCAQGALAADDKAKASTASSAPAKSASSAKSKSKSQSKSAADEKTGSATPSSADTGTGGNTTGYKKPSPPKVPQDAAVKAAPKQ